MVKKRGLFVLFVFALLFSGLNLFLFLNKKGTSYASISGMYVKEIPGIPGELNFSLIMFILQWALLLFIVIFVLLGYAKHKKEENIRVNHNESKKKRTKAVTDLDAFYNLIKEKRFLSVQSLSKIFGITKEKALEWAKILENHDLVKIEYPAFSSPEVKISEEDEEQTKEKEVENKGVEKEQRNEKGDAVPKKTKYHPIPKKRK